MEHRSVHSELVKTSYGENPVLQQGQNPQAEETYTIFYESQVSEGLTADQVLTEIQQNLVGSETNLKVQIVADSALRGIRRYPERSEPYTVPKGSF